MSPLCVPASPLCVLAGGHVSRNDFEAMAKAIVRQLKKWQTGQGAQPAPEWGLTLRLPFKTLGHKEAVRLLESQQPVARQRSDFETLTGYVDQLLEN